MTPVLLVVVATALSGQTFVESPLQSGAGCVNFGTNVTTNVVSTTVTAARNNGQETPKQGEVFFVAVNVASFSQPCLTRLTVRPGFRLPAGLVHVPPSGQVGAPVARCSLGPIGGTLAAQPCRLTPSETLADGTIIFDHPTAGFWQVPDGQVLEIRIPVRSTAELPAATLQGYVDYVSPDGFFRQPLRPQVGIRVFFNPPSVTYPSPAVTDVGPYSAHLFAFVDPHFNAGTIRAQVRRVGQLDFVTVDEGGHDGSLFELDVDSPVEGLDADTNYEFRYTYSVTRNGLVSLGAAQPFRTLPPPRFAFSATVVGGGRLTTSPSPESDGTFIDRTPVTLTALPDSGQRLVSLVVDGEAVAGASSTVTVAGPLVAVATFEALPPPPAEGEGEGEGENPGEGEGEEGDTGGPRRNDDEDVASGCASIDGGLWGLWALAGLLGFGARRRRPTGDSAA